MLQKKLCVSSIEEFRESFPAFKEQVSGITYNQVVVDIHFGNTPEKDIVEIQKVLQGEFHDLKTIGMSSGGILGFYHVESLIILNFMFMTNATATQFSMRFDRNCNSLVEDVTDYARKIRESILNIPNVRCVEVYFAWIKASASVFVDEISKGLEDIPIYGAIANANSVLNMQDLVASNNTDSVVVGEGMVAPGISVMVYSGEDMYAYCEYLFGWEPVGKAMDVKACDITNEGITILSEIDGQSAVDIYDKYLGVKVDSRFVRNICEFPLVVERDGVLIGRTPSGYGDNGEVYLEGDILPGEKVRFSYGEYDDILNGTKNGAMRMNAFGAEAISLIICGNRIIFLQNDYKLEVDYYSDGREEGALPVLGMGEIYKYKGKGGVLNSALVAVGMREGLGGQTFGTVLEPQVTHCHDGFIPLSERLSHFLKAVTGELVEAVNEAKAANEAKSAFLSNMSHEIRTPINAVLGMDEMILRESSDSQILEYAESIRSAGNSLLGIVNDILDFSKIEAGKMEIVPVEYDIASVLNDLVNMVKKRTEDKNLELVINVDPAIPHILFGDEIRIKQVLTNILTNAVKYTEKGSITLSVSMTGVDDGMAQLHYSVKDTGIGIKNDDLPKLFSAFDRIEEERNRTVEGTGLGMSITRNLLEMMGSNLGVTSVYGEGSEFYFDISQKIIKSEPIGNYEEALKRSVSDRKEYREHFTAPDALILVVDDTQMNLTVIMNLLKNTKVRIDTASSGDECIELMKKSRYDLVFLDHRMPGKDGIETLKCLKKDPRIDSSIPIVALTANAVSGSRDLYMNAGFTDYLSKPVDPDALERVMAELLPADKVHLREVDESEESDVNDMSVIPEIIRNSQFFDIISGVRNCGSSEAFVVALKSFFESAQDNLETIKRHFESGNIQEFTTRVHTLKSSSRIIGLDYLGGLAEELEKAGNAGDWDTIEKKTGTLLEIFGDVSEILGTVFEPQVSDSGKEMIEPARLREAYGAMREIARMYDYDSMIMVLDSIAGFRIPDSEKDRLNDLRAAVRNADWDRISRILT